MKDIFHSDRFFFCHGNWYVVMRPGDEKHTLHCGMREIKYCLQDNVPIAGPFKTRKSLIGWFDAFISMYGKSRSLGHNYIPDFVANKLINI